MIEFNERGNDCSQTNGIIFIRSSDGIPISSSFGAETGVSLQNTGGLLNKLNASGVIVFPHVLFKLKPSSKLFLLLLILFSKELTCQTYFLFFQYGCYLTRAIFQSILLWPDTHLRMARPGTHQTCAFNNLHLTGNKQRRTGRQGK